MTTSSGESFKNTVTSAGTVTIPLSGGIYSISASGTFNSATVVLNQLGPDGATYITTGQTLSAAGVGDPTKPLYLPAGQYAWVVGSVTSVVLSISRVTL